MIRNAIILAAGTSRRLGVLTKDCPKCLLPLPDGTTFLERAIRCLRGVGIHRIVIVAGYKAEVLSAFVHERKLDVEIRLNPAFATTNNVVSLWCARDVLREGSWVHNGDLVYNLTQCQRLLASVPARSVLLIDKRVRLGEEEMKVRTEGERLVDIGKHLDPSLCAGEYIGLSCFDAMVGKELALELDQIVSEGATNHWYEYAIGRIAPRVPISVLEVNGMMWSEVDAPDDLREVENGIRNGLL